MVMYFRVKSDAKNTTNINYNRQNHILYPRLTKPESWLNLGFKNTDLGLINNRTSYSNLRFNFENLP